MDQSGTLSKRGFLWGSSIVVVIAAVYLRLICFVLDSNVDEGLMSMGGDLLANGGLIYRDFFSVVWPGSYLILAPFFKCIGATWVVARSVLLVELLLMVVLILILSRLLIKNTFVFFPAGIFVTLGPAPWNFNYYHWDGLLFFLATAALLSFLLQRAMQADEHSSNVFFSGNYLLAAGAGLCGALAIICFQATGPSILLGFLAGALLICRVLGNKKQALLVLLAIALGFAAVITTFLIYLIATADLMPMINMTLHFVVGRYGHVNSVPYGFSKFFNQVVMTATFTPGKELEAALQIIIGCLCWLPYETIKITPALVVIACAIFFIRKGDGARALKIHPHVFLFAAMGYAFWLAELHRPDIVRLFWGSQLLIILNIFFLERALATIPAAGLAARLTVVLLIGGLSLDFFAYGYRATHNLYELSTRRGPVAAFEDWKVIKAIEAVTKPNEKILVYPYNTTVYFLSQTWFPSHFPWLQYNYHTAADFEEAIKDMEANKVQIVVWDSSLTNESFADNGFPSYAMVKPEEMIMEKYLLANFKFVKSYGRFRLMKRKSLIGCSDNLMN